MNKYVIANEFGSASSLMQFLPPNGSTAIDPVARAAAAAAQVTANNAAAEAFIWSAPFTNPGYSNATGVATLIATGTRITAGTPTGGGSKMIVHASLQAESAPGAQLDSFFIDDAVNGGLPAQITTTYLSSVDANGRMTLSFVAETGLMVPGTSHVFRLMGINGAGETLTVGAGNATLLLEEVAA